jgi:hypothetical protein
MHSFHQKLVILRIIIAEKHIIYSLYVIMCRPLYLTHFKHKRENRWTKSR